MVKEIQDRIWRYYMNQFLKRKLKEKLLAILIMFLILGILNIYFR